MIFFLKKLFFVNCPFFFGKKEGGGGGSSICCRKERIYDGEESWSKRRENFSTFAAAPFGDSDFPTTSNNKRMFRPKIIFFPVRIVMQLSFRFQPGGIGQKRRALTGSQQLAKITAQRGSVGPLCWLSVSAISKRGGRGGEIEGVAEGGKKGGWFQGKKKGDTSKLPA